MAVIEYDPTKNDAGIPLPINYFYTSTLPLKGAPHVVRNVAVLSYGLIVAVFVIMMILATNIKTKIVTVSVENVHNNNGYLCEMLTNHQEVHVQEFDFDDEDGEEVSVLLYQKLGVHRLMPAEIEEELLQLEVDPCNAFFGTDYYTDGLSKCFEEDSDELNTIFDPSCWLVMAGPPKTDYPGSPPTSYKTSVTVPSYMYYATTLNEAAGPLASQFLSGSLLGREVAAGPSVDEFIGYEGNQILNGTATTTAAGASPRSVDSYWYLSMSVVDGGASAEGGKNIANITDVSGLLVALEDQCRQLFDYSSGSYREVTEYTNPPYSCIKYERDPWIVSLSVAAANTGLFMQVEFIFVGFLLANFTAFLLTRKQNEKDHAEQGKGGSSGGGGQEGSADGGGGGGGGGIGGHLSGLRDYHALQRLLQQKQADLMVQKRVNLFRKIVNLPQIEAGEETPPGAGAGAGAGGGIERPQHGGRVSGPDLRKARARLFLKRLQEVSMEVDQYSPSPNPMQRSDSKRITVEPPPAHASADAHSGKEGDVEDGREEGELVVAAAEVFMQALEVANPDHFDTDIEKIRLVKRTKKAPWKSGAKIANDNS